MEIWPYGLSQNGGAKAILGELSQSHTLWRVDETTETLTSLNVYDATRDENDRVIAWTLLTRPR